MKKNRQSFSANRQIAKQDAFTEFLLYTTPNGNIKVEVFLHDENIWLTQKLIALLFDCSSDNVSLHLKNIFESGELQENSVSEEFSVTANDGKKYKVKHYNLDAIISVGYRVNSAKATLFRIWATERLKEYIIKGFTMDDERLKEPNTIFGKDYFEEQLARIRDIRSSERRLYQKITDIYAQCSADYSPESDITKQFFATVQNKLHFAITGKTAAEIIYERADSKRENMGLTVWKNSPKGKIRETDVIIAKNYLNEKEFFPKLQVVLEKSGKDTTETKEIMSKISDIPKQVNFFMERFGSEEKIQKSPNDFRIALNLLTEALTLHIELVERTLFADWEKYQNQ